MIGSLSKQDATGLAFQTFKFISHIQMKKATSYLTKQVALLFPYYLAVTSDRMQIMKLYCTVF